MLAQGSFNTGELDLNFMSGPDGFHPLLLLHGITGRWQDFLPIMPQLVLHHTVFAIDFRGHGESDRATDGYSFAKYAKDIVAFEKSKLDQPAVLIGHSLGGAVAVYIAANYPELTRAAVLCDPALFAEALRIPEWSEAFSAWRQIAGEPFEEICSLQNPQNAFDRRRARDLSKLDPKVLEDLNTYWDSFDLEYLLGQISCPVLLVYGNYQNGGVLTVEQAEDVTSSISNCISQFMDDVGHAPHRDKPDEFFRLVSDFLESI